jgi:hypothetical protein
MKFCTVKAADGRYNYGVDTPDTRAKLAQLPRGLFASPTEAAEALTAAIQAAFDAGAPS